jgi:hypothetical protein
MRFIRALVMVSCACLAAGDLFSQQAPALPGPAGVPDTVFYNGKIITVDFASTECCII